MPPLTGLNHFHGITTKMPPPTPYGLPTSKQGQTPLVKPPKGGTPNQNRIVVSR